MAMKLVKKTDEYSIFQRGDDRYAVKDANKQAVNGDDKARILVQEGLIKVTLPAEKPAEEEAPEEASEEAAAEEPTAEEAGASDEVTADEAAEEGKEESEEKSEEDKAD